MAIKIKMAVKMMMAIKMMTANRMTAELLQADTYPMRNLTAGSVSRGQRVT